MERSLFATAVPFRLPNLMQIGWGCWTFLRAFRRLFKSCVNGRRLLTPQNQIFVVPPFVLCRYGLRVTLFNGVGNNGKSPLVCGLASARSGLHPSTVLNNASPSSPTRLAFALFLFLFFIRVKLLSNRQSHFRMSLIRPNTDKCDVFGPKQTLMGMVFRKRNSKLGANLGCWTTFVTQTA